MAGGASRGSDGLIALAYFAVPVGIWIFLRDRPEAPLRPIAWLFSAFILLCGIGRVA